MKTLAIITVGLALPLAACNQNTAPGNDREAQLDPAPKSAPIEPASAALANVATAIIKPETLTDADVRAIGGTEGRCVFRLTEVSFPSFVFEPGRQGVIKLNGKLIPVNAFGKDRYASGDLLVSTRLLDETGNAGLQGMELIVVPPGRKTNSAIAAMSSAPKRKLPLLFSGARFRNGPALGKGASPGRK